jgi:hypothetical protein
MSSKAAHPGEKNGMFGRTHTEESIKMIVERTGWKDDDKKRAMKKKGMLTHFAKFTGDDKASLNKYMQDVLSGLPSEMPKCMNGVYKLTIDKIKDVHGSVEAFICEMRKIGYVITQGES